MTQKEFIISAETGKNKTKPKTKNIATFMLSFIPSFDQNAEETSDVVRIS